MISLISGNFPYKVGFITENLQFSLRQTMAFGEVAIYLDLIVDGNTIDTIELPKPPIELFDNSTGNAYAFIIQALLQYAIQWLENTYPNCKFQILKL